MDKRLKDENLKIAIQKDGRLTEESLKALRLMGLEFEVYGRRLYAACRNYPVEVLFCRDDDIPGYVESGVADIGIVGQNILREAGVSANEIIRPGFGYCKLVVAVPKESNINSIEDLRGKKIATTFPATTKQYFDDRGITIETTTIAGAVEITPALGVADAIADITASGSTLILNDLRPIETILETEAVFIQSNKPLTKEKSALVSQMMTRLEAALTAKNLKYIMMNAPKESLDKIKQIAPGLDAPTVMEL
ncbi:MAG: ATP phosphoribosyltransferase, partial [Acidobacteriota bacterium]